MKKFFIKLLIGVIILAGLLLLFYPVIGNYFNQHSAEQVIDNYIDSIHNLSEAEIEEQFALAKEYNDSLTSSKIKDPFIPGTGFVLPDNYTSILNIGGAIGYIEIPVIGVYLPIYHGTDPTVLEQGVGHLDQTAFPIGGDGYHSVLTAHSGLTEARMFTDVEQMKLGDLFYIHVLDRTAAYKVDQIVIVEPDTTEQLRPVSGKDYATLITCTPYTVNSHRLLVRGVRVPYTKEDVQNNRLPLFNLFPLETRVIIVLLVLMGIVLLFCRLLGKKHTKA